MKWDIDKALKSYEPESCPGTTISRVLMGTDLFQRHGIKLPHASKLSKKPSGNTVSVEVDEVVTMIPFVESKIESMSVWCLAIGFVMEPKAFFYGLTIRECFLKARKAAKAGALAQATPWGKQAFKPKKAGKR